MRLLLDLYYQDLYKPCSKEKKSWPREKLDAQRKLNSVNNDLSKSQQNIAEADKELKETDDKKAITQIKWI